MENQFKIGDIVDIIIPTYMLGNGTGEVSIVTVINSSHYIGIEGRTGLWSPHRFILAKPASRTNDPATSKGARKVNKYAECVVTLLGRNPAGLTGHDMAKLSGFPLNCITPRFAPLRRAEQIKDSGTKRDKQIVWVLA